VNGFLKVIDRAAELSKAQPQEGDYVGPQGLLICGRCGTPKQKKVKILGKERVVGCLCQCGVERRNGEQRRLEETRRAMNKERIRREGIQSGMLKDACFETARPSPLIEKAKNYVNNWEVVRENNVGLLLIGSVGVGKSYAAACICNALMKRGVRCHMTSFGRIRDMEWDERASFISTLGRYELLVLDDLGTEHHTDFMRSVVFSVIDERYQAKKPLIVTTNIGLPRFKSPPNLEEARLYDRLLEVCGPVLCEGENFRKAAGEDTRRKLSKVLNTPGNTPGRP